MFETTITKLLNIKYPIIQGGLQGLGTSPLVSAVSNAGGLGLITAGSYDSPTEFLQDIEKTRQMTSNPFGVNIAIGIRQPMEVYVEAALAAKVPIIFTSGANPEKFVPAFKENGVKWVHVVPSIRFAKKAEAMGADAIVMVGYECGGHPGREEVTSLTLVQKAVRELGIPVIAAGGFSTGRSLLAALSLGAGAVQMGTRFLATQEVALHPDIKSRLPELTENDTVIVKRSLGKPARVMKSETSMRVAEMEWKGATFEEIFPYLRGEAYQDLLQSGDVSKGVIALGQTIGLIDDIPTVAEVIENILSEAKETYEGLSGVFR
ncbi:nitronate monooxygenase [Bacillus carboniphilus]|uniref:Probable nitronate monooxygenase n=1 Tax=Bacillus carboniphilus TaxID=86663 RepID=A0ABN0VXI6_9BACI